MLSTTISMNKNAMNLFWEQPCAGLPDHWFAESTAVLLAKEKELGVKLPDLYKQSMTEQNGGSVRLKTYFDGTDYHQIFGNGCDMAPIAEVRNYTDYLNEHHSRAFIEEAMKLSDFCFLDRLVLISELDGHSLLCLDYGWLKQHKENDPAVVVFEQSAIDNTAETAFGFMESLRIPSFEKWCKSLVYHGYECDGFFLGISSTMSIDELAGKVDAITGSSLELKTDDRYGWFDFDQYYIGMADTDIEGISHLMVLSPNRFLSGTYRFQQKPDTNFILEVEPRKSLHANIDMDISKSMKKLALEIESKSDCRVEHLLYPHPFVVNPVVGPT